MLFSTLTRCRCCPLHACFSMRGRMQVIYIAPLKALVRERMDDWGAPGKFCQVSGMMMMVGGRVRRGAGREAERGAASRAGHIRRGRLCGFRGCGAAARCICGHMCGVSVVWRWGWRGAGGAPQVLGKSMVELTGDYTPDLRALLGADIIIATPEKWDGISRQWQTRGYAKKVSGRARDGRLRCNTIRYCSQPINQLV